MAWYHVAPGPYLLLLPVIFMVIALAAAGIGTMLAAMNVAYRDVRYIIPFLIQLWMFATPSVYTQSVALPDGVRSLVRFNPMEGLVAAFRTAVLGGRMPWTSLAGATALVLIMLLGGCLYFRRVEDRFADTI